VTDRVATLQIDRKARLQIEPQYVAKRPAETRLCDFREVSLGFDPETAKIEAMRCIQCPTPAPCQQACPLHNDIPLAMWLIAEGDFTGAANVYRQTSPMPEICGRICPQEVLCQGSCTVGKRDLPVRLGKLESFVADYQRRNGWFPMPPRVRPTGRRVAVVGSGPAGLTVVEDLVKRGHHVTVFEAWPRPGGLLRYGIPGFKLDKEIVAEKVAYLAAIGVHFVCNTFIGKAITLDDLLTREQFDAVFVGTGTPVGTTLDIPGETLQGIHQATDFLVRGNLPPELLPESMREKPHVGKNVVVLGGGDTAMDCVRTAKRLQVLSGLPDSKVTCLYRRTEKEMPGRGEERVNAREEGILFEYLTAPVAFHGDEQGHVKALECIRMRLGDADASGRRKPLPIEGSNFVVDADTVVCALGYKADPIIAQAMHDVRLNKWGLIVVDPMTGSTSRAGVYAGGDNVTGADLVVTAVAAGHRAATAMDSYLQGLTIRAAHAGEEESTSVSSSPDLAKVLVTG
jgi:glutamate synthase (NADPH) small chain